MKTKIYRLTLGGELVAPADMLECSYTSVNAMIAEIKAPAAVLIDGLRPENELNIKETLDAIFKLRCSSIFYAAPIYLAKPMGNLNAFVDGVGSRKEDIFPYAAEILTKMDSISIEANAANNDLRLLTFLFCRGDAFSVSPLALAGSPWIYEYPAAFLIGGFVGTTMQILHLGQFADTHSLKKLSMGSSAEWIVSLCMQGFLVAKGLIDRIRLCPRCLTGTLNYIDSCPLCGSIDFSQKKMIHCFTCGHVAPEENFRNGMMLVCPRCSVALRHIGSDYDRPVESYVCNSCGQRFIEPEVKADCLFCRQKSQTEDLAVRQLYNYMLTAKGKQAVQQGIMNIELSLFDGNRNVLPLYFYQVTDWLLQMKTRYSDEDFSLLCIKIIGIQAEESTAGITQFQKIIDELAIRIRELVRITDITTSTAANTFWVLLPRTSQAGGEILASRVEKLADMVSLENGPHIDILVRCFSIPTEYANRGPVAETLISEYESTMLEKDE